MSESKEEENRIIATFNDSDFVFEISIINSTGDLIQKFAKEEILKLNVNNDLTQYYLTGDIVIKDISNFYAILPNNIGEWYLAINIIQKDADESIENPTISGSFLITSAQIDSIDSNSAHVKLTFADPIIRIFNRNCAFSSQNDKDISIVLNDLLASVGFGVSSEEKEKDPSAEAVADVTKVPEITACNRPYNYITDANTAIINHLDFIVSQIYLKDKGFLFLYFDPYDRQLKALWSKDILKSEIDISDESKKFENISYVITIQSSDNKSRDENTAVEIMPYTYLMPFENGARIVYPTYIQNFNYRTHRVETTKENQWAFSNFEELYKDEDDDVPIIPQFVDDASKGTDEMVAFFKNAPDYALGNFYRSANEDKFYSNLRNYFIYGNMISLKVIGKAWRRVGRMYFVLYAQASNSSKLAGPWLCTKIIDSFESGKYYQYIFLTRINDKRNYEEINKFTQERIEEATNATYEQ